MKKKFFKCTAAFAAAMLMACGAAAVLPEEYLPQLGTTVSAEETDGVAVDSVNFPDDIFRQYVSDNFDKDSDGVLSDEEISQVGLINVSRSGVQSLKGIEYFNAITWLICYDNQLTSIDISNNTLLEHLDCFANQLTSLDVRNNTALQELVCDYNQITSLDISNNTVLTKLECGNNKLTSLDVSKNIMLTELLCVDNQLTSLDVSQNTALVNLNCLRNQITSLDVSQNTALAILGCGENQLTSLDVSKNIVLTKLECGENQLTSLDVSNNVALIEFWCSNNPLISLDVSNNTALTTLWCFGIENHLTSLDVSNNTAITNFICNGNYYIGEISGIYDLKNLPAGFDVTKTSNWQRATLKDDMLTEIDGTGIINYEYDCGNNHTATFSLVYDYVEPTVPSQPTEPTEPTNPTNPTNPTTPTPTTPQQPAENESETIISAKNGWGNVVKEINAANENSKINIDMGNTTNVPKNVMNAIQGKNVDIVLDMGDGITWTINGQDVTDPQSLDFSVTKKKNVIPKDVMDKVADTEDTVQLVLGHNGDFGCSATLSIDLGNNNSKKIANLYYYNTKTKKLEFVDSAEIVNGKANLVFTHASDWAIVLSDTPAEYEDVSSAAGIYEADDNSQAPLCMIAIIIAAVGFSAMIIVKRFAKNKH